MDAVVAIATAPAVLALVNLLKGLGLSGRWSALVAVSVLTIIGWAFAMTAMMRWICRHIEADAFRVEFHGKGLALLWRGFVWLIGMVLLIPLPWVFRSMYAWWTNNLVLTRTAEAAIEDDFPVYGTA